MKNKFENAIILIGSIIFIICLTIMALCLIPIICEVSIDHLGLNIGSIITVIVGYVLISMIVICVIAIKEIILYISSRSK